MRIIPFALSTIVTAGLIFALNRPWGAKVPMVAGSFLSPQTGFWQNAEPTAADFNADLKFPELKGKASVYFDERLVPHVFAENDEDLYFIQGFLHAKFRLFQMDLQTKAAEGRTSEIVGTNPKALNFDRSQRRLGMRFAAENALREIEKDPHAKAMFDAYTQGVNAYLGTITVANLPLEYKILNFTPEKWSNLRTALLLKMMAKMLSAETENDLPNTNAKSIFTETQLKMIYPQVADSLEPMIPKGTVFDLPGVVPVKPASADSIYFAKKDTVPVREVSESDRSNGSNNWVVAGSKTKSGSPILCNDPHLELSLPSIWYEIQLQTPQSNAYGVSLPGSPFVVIGFNDSIAWGVTNAQRDVKDYYEIRFKDHKKSEYWYDGKWQVASTRFDTIKIKGAAPFIDTVAYTVFGPVMYDESFSNNFSNKRNLAVRWTAHDPSDEAYTFYKLNRAHNYDEYLDAIKSFSCPGQNFIFASKTGDIALWQQGKFPARWDRQGLYVMPGEDSSYAWQGFIPQTENPHSKNPEQGFLESANQRPVDSAYPYFIPGSYITPRGVTITHMLRNMNGITTDDMKKLQNNYYNTLASYTVPLMMKYTVTDKLSGSSRRYFDIVKDWNLLADPDSKGQTIYQCWLDSLENEIWKDELSQVKPNAAWPDEETLTEALLRDSAFQFIDNINTTQKETLFDVMTTALNKAAAGLEKKESAGQLEWSRFKSPAVYHLLKENMLAFARQNLHIGGHGNIINAVTHSHGPSWRMIVQLSTPTEAYGVYPGGQSGNPGSRFYDNYLDDWVEGRYNKLWFMHDADRTDKQVKWTMTFSKG